VPLANTPQHRAPVEPPLNARYGWIVAVALLALAPNIVLTTAFPLLQKPLAAQLHMSKLFTQEAEGLSNAGYAFGAVLGAFLTQRFRQRPLFINIQALFVAAAVVATLAWNPPAFMAARITQGFATGLMLVVALPPLITRYGVERLPRTAAAVNIGLFGAVTLGPVLAGLLAAQSWRTTFAVVAAAGVAGLVIAVLAVPDIDAFDRDRRPDPPAFMLALTATVLAFFATSQLVARDFTAAIVLAPLIAGIAALVVLVVEQFRKEDPLMPARALSTSLPVIGTITAMIAGAAFVTVVELTTTNLLQARHETPLRVGLLFAPAIVGVAIAAIVFAHLFATKYLPMLVLAGMLLLIGGGAIDAASTTNTAVASAAFLLGAGAGATVSPGLFLAGMGVPSSQVGRAFALVELLRSEAAYLVGPVLLYVAMAQPQLPSGLRLATWITVIGTAVGLVAMVGLFVASGARLHAPDLEAWLDRGEQALESPYPAERVVQKIVS
jgi:MFS family permease